ncbi:glycoside hydrolase family 30 beta sandwich domain-containing protein, partial [Planococcus sp. SIMBA_143]
EGGPNHVGNYCDAPVIVDTVNDEVRYNSSYYYIGHFSKYVKEGARRIGCEISGEAVLGTSFENPDGEIVVVVMNAKDHHEAIFLPCGNEHFSTTLPLHSIATFIIR